MNLEDLAHPFVLQYHEIILNLLYFEIRGSEYIYAKVILRMAQIQCRVWTLPHISHTLYMLMHAHNIGLLLSPTLVALYK